MTQTFNEDVVFNDQVTANDNVTIQGDDGRLHVGDDLGFSTDESYIEVHRDNTAPTTKPKRGLHTLGRIGGAISDAVAWLVSELEFPGTGTISGIHSALRARLTHSNSGDSSDAALQAGSFEVENESGTSSVRVGQATAIQATITNKDSGYLKDAIGVAIEVNNENENSSPIQNAYGLHVADVEEADNNYALHTGKGTVHLGDELELPTFASAPTNNPPTGYLKVYPKVDGTPKLYAKDDQGVEHILGGGGSSGSQTVDDLTVNDSLTYVDGASNGRVLVSDANGLASWQDAVPTVLSANDVYQQVVLQEINLQSTAPAISFDTISQDYDHLIVIGELRSTYSSSTNDNLLYTLNADGAEANYKSSILYWGDSGGTASPGFNHYGSSSSRRHLGWIAAAQTDAETFTHIKGEMLSYTNTARNKRFGVELDVVYGASNEYQYIVKTASRWISTSALTTIQLTLGGGSFVIGSWAKLIGVKKRSVVTSVTGPVFGTGIAPTPENALIGELRMTATTTPPSGWLICDGTAVSRSTYSDLFNVIGTTYGVGDGSTTFNVPDLRGRVPIGAGQGSGLTNRTMGQALGEENHQLTISELPAHNHTLEQPPKFTSDVVSGSARLSETSTTTNNWKVYTMSNTGSDQPHNNIQPVVVVNYIIKY